MPLKIPLYSSALKQGRRFNRFKCNLNMKGSIVSKLPRAPRSRAVCWILFSGTHAVDRSLLTAHVPTQPTSSVTSHRAVTLYHPMSEMMSEDVSVTPRVLVAIANFLISNYKVKTIMSYSKVISSSSEHTCYS